MNKNIKHIVFSSLKDVIKISFLLIFSVFLFIDCKATVPTTSNESRGNEQIPVAKFSVNSLIPIPQLITTTKQSFVITSTTAIYFDQGSQDLMNIGKLLAENLNSVSGKNISVLPATLVSETGNIYLTILDDSSTKIEEGYSLNVTDNAVSISAASSEGVFRGVQTVIQLLGFSVESSSDTLWGFPGIVITDFPRFVWRGAMLDVARHFFSVNDVKRFIDLMSIYKLNRLHLHLSDDQGWRVEIKSRPKLTTIGGTTQVGGAIGSFFYTQEQYSEIVAYAQSKYVVIIPEFDMPGHITAALASYSELTCNGISPAVYTGIDVGLPGLCVTKDTVYSFVKDVVREIAALTPGPYFHIGGDESNETVSEYINFINRVEPIVQSYGKTMIGWEEIGQGNLSTSSIMQFWNKTVPLETVHKGVKVIFSPSKKIYLDMKYTTSTTLGQNWAGYIEVQKAYEWDPASEISGISEEHILGVEAPLWTEKVFTIADIEYMTFPRLIGLAEIGWSAKPGRNWNEYKLRLADHGIRLKALGVNFYQSPQVPWSKL